MKIRIGQQLILFHRKLKIGVVRFSVSPGHTYIALYRKIEVRMNVVNLAAEVSIFNICDVNVARFLFET